MSAPEQPLVRNRILSTLDVVDYRRLQPSLEPVVLRSDEVMYSPGQTVQHLYFPENAVVSRLFHSSTRKTVEVAMEGNESAVGLADFFGGSRSFDLSVVRDGGSAMRMEVDAFTRFIERRGDFRVLVQKSVHALVTQVAQTGVCGRFHRINARFARWLLMTHDRVGSGEIQATQESIARHLGVRRSGVTTAAAELQKRGIIDYRRGRIVVLDRNRLQARCCLCYGVITRQYDSFLR